MVDEGRDILCQKCQTKMVMDEILPPKSLELYSGSSNITNSSVATSATIDPWNTFSPATSGETGLPKNDIHIHKTIIKIRRYTCPSCGWKAQLRL